MKELLAGLRAAGEQTRLRILTVLSQGELTVTELTRVLNQSQPRVSRHLKLLSEAGLIDRIQEGAWVFYRLASTGLGADLAQALLGLLGEPDPDMKLDQMRLDHIRQEHASEASAYFSRNAGQWDTIRRLHVREEDIEAAMLDAAGDDRIGHLVDIGTGTGRILELFAGRARSAVGIDFSPEMLTIARARLQQSSLGHCQVRRGDARQLAMDDDSADLVTIHQVLHFLDEPVSVVREAARILKPDGLLLIVDFLPHDLEFLRNDYAHRRLGFSRREVQEWAGDVGLELVLAGELEGESLNVGIWGLAGKDTADRGRHRRIGG